MEMDTEYKKKYLEQVRKRVGGESQEGSREKESGVIVYGSLRAFLISLFTGIAISGIVSLLFYKCYIIPELGLGGTSVKKIDMEHEVEVPNLVGLELETAKSVLKSYHLLLEIKGEAESEKVPQGRILSQEPLSGSVVKKESSIKVVVSKGSATIILPDFSKKTLSEVKSTLKKLQLKLGRVEKRHSSTIPANCIISTQPPPGQTLKRGSIVSLVVSLGEELISVPNLSGLTLARATERLEKAQLRCGKIKYVTNIEYRFGVIIAQEPRAGAKVKKGQKVNLTINEEASE
jgi:serine/threonine-protein kinase